MRKVTVFLASATVAAVFLFAGVRLLQPGQAREAILSATEAPPPSETVPPVTEPPDPRTEICRKAAPETGHIFVYHVNQRKMLYTSEPSTQKLYPASITKLFSAWVALQYLQPDTVITAGWELGLLQPGSSTAFIGMDCALTAEMLVEAMLLPSGNDAAYVLAAAAGRAAANDPGLTARQAVTFFVSEMNRMAAEVGLGNSHFENPDGYHHQDHWSCLSDLATIGELALENEIIAKYAALQQDSVRFASGETITWYNTNRLLNPESAWYCENAIGLKTGYTEEAGYCLLAAFEEQGETYLVGIFDGQSTLSRYCDAVNLFKAAKTGDG